MSPRRTAPVPPTVSRTVDRLAAAAASVIDAERRRRAWTLRQLADRAGISAASAQAVVSGVRVSLDTYPAVAHALGLRIELTLSDPRSRTDRTGPGGRIADIVHSAMGELEAAHLRRLGHQVAIDEPYQHFQFAGRADMLAWDLEARALLHIENRTRFPDLQAAAGSWNAKRAYLAPIVADRLGIRAWASVTHVMACLWSAEILHSLRLRAETFRALCPDPSDGFAAWWAGTSPAHGVSSVLVVLDPWARDRQRRFVDLHAALVARPRVRGYAEAAAMVGRR